VGCAAGVLVVAASVPIASGIAAVRRAHAAPPRLVGQWTRKVTTADVRRERTHLTPQEAIDAGAGTTWTLTIHRNGKSSLAGIKYWTGTVDPAGAGRVHIYAGFYYANVYKWRVSGRVLTLTEVNDSVSLRGTVLSGVWKRKV
jgi:hypothetical protein